MRSSLEAPYQKCFSRVQGVIFCGTPHRGSNAASWCQLASSLVSMALMDSNVKLLGDLEFNSQTLESIQDGFLKTLHQSAIKIHSFQEGRALSAIKGLNRKVKSLGRTSVSVFGIPMLTRWFPVADCRRLFLESRLAVRESRDHRRRSS